MARFWEIVERTSRKGTGDQLFGFASGFLLLDLGLGVGLGFAAVLNLDIRRRHLVFHGHPGAEKANRKHGQRR